MLRFWNRVLKMDENRITCRIFDYYYKLNEANWCYAMKQLFSNVKKNKIYDEKMICNIYELQQLMPYIAFKDNYCTEKYVKKCLPRKQRSLLAQIRFGILPLHIEMGRFRSLNLKERTCKICNSQEIEDEFLLLYPVMYI